jgi:aminoglycoside phosphotransferase (APT) family kinase protein
MESRVASFVARHWKAAPSVDLDLQRVHGGLESQVARAIIRSAHPSATNIPRRFMVKELKGTHQREADIYRVLWNSLTDPPAARLLGVEREAVASYLYLEDVLPICSWPWREHEASAAVCRALAQLHDARLDAAPLQPWDADDDLLRSAGETLRVVSTAPTGTWRRPGDLRRVVTALPTIRQRLLDVDATLIHGDIHPGNVIVRQAHGPCRVALIDWARARIASPLEDIASWLHSLGCWDPEMRRRHDSLLREYLAARRPALTLTAEVRGRYWLASACNGLWGAIRYHVTILGDPSVTGSARWHSRRALDEWERITRGAARVLAPTPRC